MSRTSAQVSLPDETTHFSKSTGTIKIHVFNAARRLHVEGKKERYHDTLEKVKIYVYFYYALF